MMQRNPKWMLNCIHLLPQAICQNRGMLAINGRLRVSLHVAEELLALPFVAVWWGGLQCTRSPPPCPVGPHCNRTDN